ncbi:hypothetical protein X738_01185 [Mesorhizobium sp. LNHC209A00]|nr:hypothetical protein X738_01185 [Mesorhizobium sp. LNHC209A00]
MRDRVFGPMPVASVNLSARCLRLQPSFSAREAMRVRPPEKMILS